MIPDAQLRADRRQLLVSFAKLAGAFLGGFISPADARADAATHGFKEGYAKGDGVRLYFVQAGEMPLMLFIHGAPDSWELYEGQLREFGRDHLVVAPNLRGYSPSDAPDGVEPYTMPHRLADVHGLLDHFGRERCIL